MIIFQDEMHNLASFTLKKNHSYLKKINIKNVMY
jgi:hypothetical protein